MQKFRNSSVMLEAPHYRPKVRHSAKLWPEMPADIVPVFVALLHLERPNARVGGTGGAIPRT